MSQTSCSLHPGEPSVDVCASCGRPACLACAVPVRGDTFCSACAARLVGSVAEEPVPRRRSADVVAGTVFLLAAIATTLPWDRVGALSGFLSAWIPRRAPWAFLTGVLALLAASASLRRREESRWARLGRVALGLAAAVAAIVALPAPNLSARGPVPFVVAALLWLGVALSLTRGRRIAPRP